MTPPGAGDASDAMAARELWARMRALTGAPDVVEAEHRFMREAGLSGGPVRALRGLLDGGPQSMRALAERLGCDKSYVTSLVKPLVEAGFATLEPDPRDGRVKTVTLTDLGAAIAVRAREVYETPPALIRDLDAATARRITELLS
jgi:DNA-binding MarR family transcriptional regulator